jgi:hypothetical protein
MQRFLPPRELARDVRFKRANSKNELFRTLPDDVPEIVRVLEQVAPKLRERVAGTALEAVYDDLGPGFMFLTTAAGTAQSTERTPLQLRAQLHGIFVGELPGARGREPHALGLPRRAVGIQDEHGAPVLGRGAPRPDLREADRHVGGALGEFPRTPSCTRRRASRIPCCALRASTAASRGSRATRSAR